MTQLKFRKTPSPEADVVSVIAEERRTDHGILADMAETLAEQRVTFGDRQRERSVVTHHPRLGGSLVGAKFGIGTIELAREHFLFLGFQPISPSLGNASGAAASATRAWAESSSICYLFRTCLLRCETLGWSHVSVRPGTPNKIHR